MAEATSGKGGVRATATIFLEMFEPEVCAFITSKVVLDKLTARTNKLQSVAVQVGKALFPQPKNTRKVASKAKST